MDQVTNERKRTPRKSTFKLQIGKFSAEIGNDVKWYWDIRLWAPLLIILFIIALWPSPKAAVQPEAPQQMQQEVQQQEEIPEETAPAPTVTEARDPEAEALARLADTVGAGRTDNVKVVIMWVAINRSEDRANGYGKSLEEEISRANQWQFYDENAKYGEGTYMLAQDVLKVARSNGLRPVENDMLWFVLNDNGSITVRNQFNFNKNTNQKTYK